MKKSSQEISRIIYISFLCAVFVSCAAAADVTCAKIKYAFSSKGLFDTSDQDSSSRPIRLHNPDDQVTICPPQGSRTCCSADMERKLSQKIRVEMNEALERNLAVVLSNMATTTIKFDRFFQDLLVKAKEDFHQLFIDTYGVMYRQNSHVALKLFDDLLAYYKTGTPDLNFVLDDFFVRLYETMFTVTHRQYKFDENHFKCMRGMMNEVQPFGNIPRRLSAEIKRAFVASRIFVQALAVGSNIMKTMMQLGVASDCTKALMKMSYCPQCQGYVDLKPCNNYCLNVMKGCLAYHSELSPQWEEYVAKLMKMSVRLEDAFNIEDVVNPINIEISHAIMNFQDNRMKISKKVMEKCGQGNLMKKRSIAGEIKHEPYKFPGGKDDFIMPSIHGNRKASGITLKNHIAEIRKNMKILRTYWKNLPHHMCSNDNVAAKPIIEEDCWNGLNKARYQQAIIGDGLLNQSKNPEVSINVHKQNSQVNDLIISLKLTTNRLLQAHDGIYVNWTGSELSGIENLELDDLITSAEITNLNKFNETLVEGSGSGGDEECANDDCDDNPVSTFTLTGSSTSTQRPSPLTTTDLPVYSATKAVTTSTPIIKPTTSSPSTTEYPDIDETIDCEGSGCSSGSGDMDKEDDEDFGVIREEVWSGPPNSPNVNGHESEEPTTHRIPAFTPDFGSRNKDVRTRPPHSPNINGNKEPTTHRIPAFTPDIATNNKDLYFPTTHPDPFEPYGAEEEATNEIVADRSNIKATSNPSGASHATSLVMPVLLACIVSTNAL